jgi:transcriptional regulator with XRE-family HTH domain
MDMFDIIESMNDGGLAARKPVEDAAEFEDDFDPIDADPEPPAPQIPNSAPPGWRERPAGSGSGIIVSRRIPKTPEVTLLGQYVRRSRYYAEKSQSRLSGESGVTQSMISRLERGVAPGMRVDRLVALASSLGRVFPLGYCPHNHECAWDALRRPGDPPPLTGNLERLIVGSDLEVPSRSHFILGD